ITLGQRVGPAAIIAAYYRDGNADGFIDTVVITLKRPVSDSSMRMITVKWSVSLQNIRIDTVPVNSLARINDSTFSVPVHGDFLAPKMVRTNVPMEIFVAYFAFPDLPPSSAIVADGAAPVLDSARLYYSNKADSTVLTVTFSESVQQPGNMPFIAWSKSNGVQYQFMLTPLSTAGAVCAFRVDTIIGGAVPYAGAGDSLWINAGGLSPVSDMTGNAQTNPANRRVALVVITQPPVWNFTLSKNPFTAGTGSGTEISASSNALIIDADQYTLSISIYDVIGNLVITMPMPPKGNGWACFWDGRNRYGRLVGSGVYSGLINIYKNNAAIQTKRIRIGVKR
ncbi:MAG: hypothetical protein WBM07_01430, partial [Chitinivibrionales bacterium]